MHDWRNYQTCHCGERGCGSYRPFPGAPTSREMRGETVEPDELRMALTAFAIWLFKDEPGEGREVELVDRFIRETA